MSQITWDYRQIPYSKQNFLHRNKTVEHVEETLSLPIHATVR